MRPSAWRLIMMPVMWLVLFGLMLATESSVPAVSLRRHKRDWQWNTIFVDEEKRDPPHYIGKLSSSKSNNYTTYKIEGDGANTIFIVDRLGDIYAQRTLDRELKGLYKLRAKLIDSRTNQQVDKEGDFEIKVNDINDNKPTFPQNYKGSVNERASQGTMVMRVTATDEDDPTTANGIVEYKLLSGMDLFNIDHNGDIRTRVNYLDREKQSTYTILVQAKDMPGHNAGNSATTTVTINVLDINDNMAVFKRKTFSFNVKEDEKQNFKIGTMELEDKDEEQNKDPVFTVHTFPEVFKVVKNQMRDGVLTLNQELDYETKNMYIFKVEVIESALNIPADNQDESHKRFAEVIVTVIDVNEPPVFTQQTYNFSIAENSPINTKIGRVSAKDPDTAKLSIRYHIDDPKCPVAINPETGEMTVVKNLDRELASLHEFTVTAVEMSGKEAGLKSHATVNLSVTDVNDNDPTLIINGTIFACEGDKAGTVIKTVGARDKDEHTEKFSFSLAKPNFNFTLSNNQDNTANITVRQGGFNQDDPIYRLEVVVSDNGIPNLSSTTTVEIPVCSCDAYRRNYYCKAAPATSNASFHALIAIILCILTILVIIILIVLRKRWRKETLVTLGKNSEEIHEQLVTYDEEGGGEMDTNGFDVSILNSARSDTDMLPAPGVYAIVNKPPAPRGDMATMIEVKKGEADHDRDGIPYDTLHIYGYEGPESLAGSLSSLETCSDDSSLDYDFLSDWGPRFKTLAELYGVDVSEN